MLNFLSENMRGDTKHHLPRYSVGADQWIRHWPAKGKRKSRKRGKSTKRIKTLSPEKYDAVETWVDENIGSQKFWEALKAQIICGDQGIYAQFIPSAVCTLSLGNQSIRALIAKNGRNQYYICGHRKRGKFVDYRPPFDLGVDSTLEEGVQASLDEAFMQLERDNLFWEIFPDDGTFCLRTTLQSERKPFVTAPVEPVKLFLSDGVLEIRFLSKQ